MKTIACYIRVSNDEDTQEVQKLAINRWLKENGIALKSVRWYIDKSTSNQQAMEKLQAVISKRKVDTVVVWRLERIAPKQRDGVNTLSDWSKRPLRIVAVTQSIDFKGGANKVIASVVSGLAEMSYQYRREQTKLGLEKARAQGRLGGRPRLSADDPRVVRAKKLHKSGRIHPIKIAARLGISKSTFWRYIDM